MPKGELFEEKETALIPVAPIVPMEPMQMIQAALQSAIGKGEGLEVYDRLLERMERQRDYDDRAAFNAALQRIQSKLKVIVKDATITGKGKYASSKAVDKAIVDAYRIIWLHASGAGPTRWVYSTRS